MKSLLRFIAYSYVTVLTVTAPGQSIATGVLIVALSGLAELSRCAAQLRCYATIAAPAATYGATVFATWYIPWATP